MPPVEYLFSSTIVALKQEGGMIRNFLQFKPWRGLELFVDLTPDLMAQLAIHSKDSNNILQSWAQPDYTGTLDTNGNKNLYIENSDFHAFLNAADNDDNGQDGVAVQLAEQRGVFPSHGFDTSSIGQRYFEYYNNIGVFNGYNDGTTFNMNWWFYVRGGTYIIHDNTLPALQSGDYGTKADINMTEQSLQRSTGNYAGCWGQGEPARGHCIMPHVKFGMAT